MSWTLATLAREMLALAAGHPDQIIRAEHINYHTRSVAQRRATERTRTVVVDSRVRLVTSRPSSRPTRSTHGS